MNKMMLIDDGIKKDAKTNSDNGTLMVVVRLKGFSLLMEVVECLDKNRVDTMSL